MKKLQKNLQKSKPLGACLFLASRPTCNITSRTIRRHDEAKTRPAGRFEDPELQARIQMLSGWARHQWAKAGHPTVDREIFETLTVAVGDWKRYRRAQCLRLGRFWDVAGMSIDEARHSFEAFAKAMAGASDDARGMAEALQPWQIELMAEIERHSENPLNVSSVERDDGWDGVIIDEAAEVVSVPPGIQPGVKWLDTTDPANPVVRIWNADNTAWIKDEDGEAKT